MPGAPIEGHVEALALSATHSFSKPTVATLTLIAGLGVEGDAHCGATVKHRSRVAVDPNQPNLRQVHLIHGELIDELVNRGFPVAPGILGENMLTRGIDLLGLPTGTRLTIGPAEIEITGLRNPCAQLDAYAKGLTAAVLHRDAQGRLVRKAGVMAVVHRGGQISVGNRIVARLPPPPHHPLERV